MVQLGQKRGSHLGILDTAQPFEREPPRRHIGGVHEAQPVLGALAAGGDVLEDIESDTRSSLPLALLRHGRIS